jgi:hypothetical protein
MALRCSRCCTMTSKLAFTVLAALLAANAFAGDKPSTQELLEAAHKASDLSAFGPYVLTGTLVVNPGTKKELTGSLAVYRDRDRARVDVVIANQSETRITIGNKDYVDPERILFAGSWLNEFDRISDPESLRHGINLREEWGPAEKRKVGGAAAWCMDRAHDPRKGTLCVDAQRKVVLSMTPAEFSDFTTVGGALLPQTIRITDAYAAPVEVRNIKVASYAVEPSLFATSSHAMELEACADREPEKLIDAPIPVRSDLSMHATNSRVALFSFVDKEGRVAAIRILTPVQPAFNARILEAIKKWRFKPVTCGGRPVNSAFTIEADGHFF